MCVSPHVAKQSKHKPTSLQTQNHTSYLLSMLKNLAAMGHSLHSVYAKVLFS